jgi:hypothetical protein
LAGDVARIAGVGFAGDGIHDVADQHHGGLLVERIDFGCGGVRDHQHVAGVDGLPSADTGAVESEAVFKARSSVNSLTGTVKCCHIPGKSINAKIDHLYAFLFNHCHILVLVS